MCHSKNWYKNNTSRVCMEPVMRDKYRERPDGAACVKQQLCRYVHSQDELVRVTSEESRGRVCFVDETRGQHRQTF